MMLPQSLLRIAQRFAPLALMVAFFLPATPALSHSSSTTFIEVIEISGEQNKIRLDLPMRDLALRFDLDQDRDGDITWREIKAQQLTVMQWINAGMQVYQ